MNCAAEAGEVVAIIGSNGSGKSTLINRLLGYNRMITSSLSGTTHDSIEMDFVWKNYEFTIVDTAGMRKKSKIKEELEYKFVGSSLQAIKLTNIAVLVLDSSEELNKQDLSIARWVIEEGRALILCLNKWDLIQEKQKTFNKFLSRLNRSLPNMIHSTIVKTSLLKLWSLHFIKVLNFLCSHIGQDVISFNWCFTWNM